MRRVVVVLTLLTTILAAVVAGLEVEASTQADVANRNSQRLALEASALTVSHTVAERYQTDLIADVLAATQESLALGATALELSAAGNGASAAEVGILAEAATARAASASLLSDVYQDPRYAPTTEGGFPDLAGYLSDRNDVIAEIVSRQNAAADAYNDWDARSSAYVAVLSVLAITFFLLGLAQVSKRMRPFLAGSAALLMAIVVGWATSIAMG